MIRAAPSMTYDPKTFTYGVELEYADWHVNAALPAGCKWNHEDYTIVNSNGIANDPTGQLYEYGGEINTRPTDTVCEQLAVIGEINQSICPAINYRCNLHIHIGVPGLNRDLEACKRLLRYVTRWMPVALPVIEPIPIPTREEYPDSEAFKGARKRCARRRVSHQKILSTRRVEAALASNTVERFHQSEAALDKDGKRLWFITPRCAVNLRQLFETTQTIEFRHFPGTLSDVEFEAALIWCREFLTLALHDGGDPLQTLKRLDLQFPKFHPYRHDLEQMWIYTSPSCNDRKTLIKRFQTLKTQGIIA